MEYITSLGRSCCDSLSPGNFVWFCWDCSGALQNPRKKKLSTALQSFLTHNDCLSAPVASSSSFPHLNKKFPLLLLQVDIIKKKKKNIYIYIGWSSCTSATKIERKKRARLRNERIFSCCLHFFYFRILYLRPGPSVCTLCSLY